MNNFAKEDIIPSQKEGVRLKIREDTSLTWSYLIMNVLAATLACYGLFANSPAVVIGAMVVAMLLGPIIGISLALVDNDTKLLKIGLFTLASGALSVFVISFVLGTIHKDIPLTNEILARTSPNLIDLMIALTGGVAVAFATVSPRVNITFIGVAIATALVPPLSSVGILVARGEFGLSFGALLLTFTNAVAIQFASSVVLWLTGFRRVTQNLESGLKVFIRRNFASLAILVLLGVALTLNLNRVIAKQLFETKTRRILQQEISVVDGNFLAEVRFEDQNTSTIIHAVVRGPNQPSIQQVIALEKKLPLAPNGKPIELRVRFVYTTVINREGYLYQDVSP